MIRKIESVKVTKLFGIEGNDYTVEFVEDSSISFMYAFNGIGKTSLLRLVYAVINQDFILLKSIGFETIEITFTNKEQMKVNNLIGKQFGYEELEKYNGPDFPFVYYLKIKKNKYIGFKNITINFQTEEEINLLNTFTDTIKTSILFANKDYDRQNPHTSNETVSVTFENLWMAIKDIPDVIEQLKIFMSNDGDDVVCSIEGSTTRSIAKPMRDISVCSPVGSTIGSLAGPMGLVGGAVVGSTIGSVIGLFNRYKKDENLKKEFKSFDEYGRYMEKKYGKIEIPLPDKIDELQEKLEQVFAKNDDLILKIKLFEDIINSSNTLTEKTIVINTETHKLEIKNKYDDYINPKYLSSGEKNLILLYFFIIFNFSESNDYTHIVFIDEPEVSMNSVWLINVVDNIEHINSVLKRDRNFQYIIATHSPSITYYNNELMVELKNGNRGK